MKCPFALSIRFNFLCIDIQLLHEYFLMKCLWIIFRLGPKFSALYSSCPIETSKNKPPLHFDVKCERAMLNTDSCRHLSLAIARKIFFCVEVQMLRNFLQELHRIYELFEWFNEKYSMKCITCMIKHKVYFTVHFVKMSQRDCYALLCDIASFTQRVSDYVKTAQNREGIETYCRLSLTVNEYMKNVEPAFHDRPPKSIAHIKWLISNDEQLI